MESVSVAGTVPARYGQNDREIVLNRKNAPSQPGLPSRTLGLRCGLSFSRPASAIAGRGDSRLDAYDYFLRGLASAQAPAADWRS
jgi:hypothetical protein